MSASDYVSDDTAGYVEQKSDAMDARPKKPTAKTPSKQTPRKRTTSNPGAGRSRTPKRSTPKKSTPKRFGLLYCLVAPCLFQDSINLVCVCQNAPAQTQSEHNNEVRQACFMMSCLFFYCGFYITNVRVSTPEQARKRDKTTRCESCVVRMPLPRSCPRYTCMVVLRCSSTTRMCQNGRTVRNR